MGHQDFDNCNETGFASLDKMGRDVRIDLIEGTDRGIKVYAAQGYRVNGRAVVTVKTCADVQNIVITGGGR